MWRANWVVPVFVSLAKQLRMQTKKFGRDLFGVFAKAESSWAREKELIRYAAPVTVGALPEPSWLRISPETTATLSGVTLPGTLNKSVLANYAGSAADAPSTSNALLLLPWR